VELDGLASDGDSISKSKPTGYCEQLCAAVLPCQRTMVLLPCRQHSGPGCKLRSESLPQVFGFLRLANGRVQVWSEIPYSQHLLDLNLPLQRKTPSNPSYSAGVPTCRKDAPDGRFDPLFPLLPEPKQGERTRPTRCVPEKGRYYTLSELH
jgi:hypothetical protein